MSQDERCENLYENLDSRDNGYYHFNSSLLTLRRSIPLPQAIIQQYENLECKSFVGILSCINRVFITIDNKLFLWNYHDGSDFYCYDEFSQIIIAVGIVKPKPHIFVESIQYVLLVSTPAEILMFAIKFENDNVFSPLTLYPSQSTGQTWTGNGKLIHYHSNCSCLCLLFHCSAQYIVPSDNIHMLKIVGTNNGRILMCGKDGNIYELEYHAKDSWIPPRKKCR